MCFFFQSTKCQLGVEVFHFLQILRVGLMVLSMNVIWEFTGKSRRWDS